MERKAAPRWDLISIGNVFRRQKHKRAVFFQ